MITPTLKLFEVDKILKRPIQDTFELSLKFVIVFIWQ